MLDSFTQANEWLNKPTLHAPQQMGTDDVKWKKHSFQVQSTVIPASLWNNCIGKLAKEGLAIYLISKEQIPWAFKYILINILYLFSVCLKRFLPLLLLQEPLSLMIISSVSLTPATGCRVSVSYLHLNPNNTLVGLKHHFQKSTSLPSRVSTLEESWQQEHLYLYLMSLCLILCLDVSGFKLHLFVLVLTFTTRMRRLHLVLFPCKSAVIKSSLDLLS